MILAFATDRAPGRIPTNDTYVPEERLTVEQAVNAYTQASAYARFSDDKLGTLEAGKVFREGK